MAMTCPNCKATHGCGCQARKAEDGKACCSKCVDAYNKGLKNKPAAAVNKVEGPAKDMIPRNPAPVINRIILTKNKR